MAIRGLLLMSVMVGLLGCSGSKTGTVVVPKTPSSAGAASGQGGGRNAILQAPFDQAAKLVLLNIGQAYRMAIAANGKPPKNADDLGVDRLKTRRDGVDHEIEVLYGVDPSKLEDHGSKHPLAWEKTPDASGGRIVLMADCVTVSYVNDEAFHKMPKAK